MDKMFRTYLTDDSIADLEAVRGILATVSNLIDAQYAGDLLDAVTWLRNCDSRLVEQAGIVIEMLDREEVEP